MVRHLGLFSGRAAADLARAEHRPIEQIEPILRPPGRREAGDRGRRSARQGSPLSACRRSCRAFSRCR